MPVEAAALREILAERDLRWLLAAQYLAQAADGVAQAVFANLLVLEPLTQGTASRILRVTAFTLLPYSLIAPFLGVFVDRWRRREVLVRTNVIRALTLVSLPVWSRAVPRETALYMAVLALLGLGRLFLTTKGAVLPVLLHEHHLLGGNSLSSGGGMIAALTGGIAGAGLALVVEPATSFVIAGLVYGAAAWSTTRIGDPLAHARVAGEGVLAAIARVVKELREGLRAVWERNRARLPLAGIFVLRTLGMLAAFAAIIVIKNEFPGAEGDVGRLSLGALALGAAGVGAFAGATTAPLLGRRFNEPQLVLVGFALSGGSVVALGGIVSVPAVLAMTFLGGYGGFVAKIAVDAQVQQALPDDFRGRAFALYDILYNLASVAAAIVMVVFLEGAGFRGLMVSAAAVTLSLAGLLGVAMQRAGLLAAPTVR